jgi:hypothetical protein
MAFDHVKSKERKSSYCKYLLIEEEGKAAEVVAL